MKESNKKNSEHTQVMQKMTVQRKKETIASKQAHKDLMKQYNNKAKQNREQEPPEAQETPKEKFIFGFGDPGKRYVPKQKKIGVE